MHIYVCVYIYNSTATQPKVFFNKMKLFIWHFCFCFNFLRFTCTTCVQESSGTRSPSTLNTSLLRMSTSTFNKLRMTVSCVAFAGTGMLEAKTTCQ